MAVQRHPTARAALCLALAVTGVAMVGAQPASAESDAHEAALGALKLAQLEYQQGRYKEAARLFNRAWQLDPRPEYLFNAARAAQRAFDLDDAEARFKRLLELPGVAEEVRRRAEIHRTEIRETRAHYARSRGGTPPATAAGASDQVPGSPPQRADAAATPATPGTAAAITPKPGVSTSAARPAAGGDPTVAQFAAPATGLNVGAWATVGAGTTAGIGAAAVWWLARGETQELEDLLAERDPLGRISGVGERDAHQRATHIGTLRTLSAGLGITALIVIGAGAWWLWADDTVAASAWAQPDSAGLGLQARF